MSDDSFIECPVTIAPRPQKAVEWRPIEPRVRPRLRRLARAVQYRRIAGGGASFGYLERFEFGGGWRISICSRHRYRVRIFHQSRRAAREACAQHGQVRPH